MMKSETWRNVRTRAEVNEERVAAHRARLESKTQSMTAKEKLEQVQGLVRTAQLRLHEAQISASDVTRLNAKLLSLDHEVGLLLAALDTSCEACGALESRWVTSATVIATLRPPPAASSGVLAITRPVRVVRCWSCGDTQAQLAEEDG
jgi:hypothetical protein